VLAKVKVEQVVHVGGSGDVFTLKVPFPNRSRTPAMVTQIRVMTSAMSHQPNFWNTQAVIGSYLKAWQSHRI